MTIKNIVDNRITDYVDEFVKCSGNLIISAYKVYAEPDEFSSEDDSDEDPFSENGRQLRDGIAKQKLENYLEANFLKDTFTKNLKKTRVAFKECG